MEYFVDLLVYLLIDLVFPLLRLFYKKEKTLATLLLLLIIMLALINYSTRMMFTKYSAY